MPERRLDPPRPVGSTDARADSQAGAAAPRRQLSLFDSTSIIVGIILGVGIYQTAPDVAKGAGCWWGVLLIWLVGGLLSLCGAMNYAELATAYPRAGGDYVYLSRAYGRWAGFLFGWIQLVLVRPGDIAVLAFAFATYALRLWNPGAALEAFIASAAGGAEQLGGAAATGWGEPLALRLYAGGAVLTLTMVNVLGARAGAWTQNLLTVVKALGVLAIVGVGLFGPSAPPATADAGGFPLRVALILVLFTYGGWNEMAYVAAEVRSPERNITRALLLGMAAVIVLYLLLNTAFLSALGYAGLAGSKAVAADTIAATFPRWGGRLIAALICISALGALNGQVFTGARILYALGADHRAFRALGCWDAVAGAPQRALVLQGIVAMALILVLGSFIEAVIYTAAAVYLFYGATSLSVIVLRRREPNVARPYRVTGYPLTPVVFCAVCGLLIYSAFVYRPWLSAAALSIAALGLPVYWLTRKSADPR